MPKALANRMMHIEIAGSYEAWRAWAVSHGINEKIIGFLAFRPDRLMGFSPGNDDLAFATPRAWEMVSNLMNNVSDDIDEMFTLIAGIVGSGVAVEFRTWAAVYITLPDVGAIFDGTEQKVPRRTDTLYALISAMTKYASEHRDEMDRIANSIAYADMMPADFSAVLMQDYLNIEEGYRLRLMGIPEFTRWLRTKGALLNGI